MDQEPQADRVGTVRNHVRIPVLRVAALAVLGLAMSGCALLTPSETRAHTAYSSAAAADQVPGQAATSPTAAGDAASREDRFVADVVHAFGQSTGLARPQIVTVGQHLCIAIAGAPSHAALIDQLSAAKMDPQVMEVFLSSAQTELCPQAVYDDPTAAPLTFAPTTGALTTISDGTYEVGTGPGQVLPGSYHSTGPYTLLGTCHYSRVRINDGSLIDIIRQHDTFVATSLTIAPTDGYVQVSGCMFTLT